MTAIGTWIETSRPEIAALLDVAATASPTLFERVAPSLLFALVTTSIGDTPTIEQRLEGSDDDSRRDLVTGSSAIAAIVLAHPAEAAAVITKNWAIVAGHRGGWTAAFRIDDEGVLMRVRPTTLASELTFQAESLAGLASFAVTWSCHVGQSQEFLFRDGALGGGSPDQGAQLIGEFDGASAALVSLLAQLPGAAPEGITT